MKFKNLFKKSGSKNTEAIVATSETSQSNKVIENNNAAEIELAPTPSKDKGHVVRQGGNGLA